MASVSYASAVLTNLRAWSDLAISVGFREEFLAALHDMDDRLENDPRGWGGPLWEYQSLKLTCHQRTGPVLIVRYAIHADNEHVFVQDVRLVPGSFLADLLE